MNALAAPQSAKPALARPGIEGAAAFAALARQHLGAPSSWLDRHVVSESLALCVIEAAQATCSGFATVCSVIDRYQEYQRTKGEPGPDSLRDLLETFDAVGGPSIWAGKVGNFRRRYTGDGPTVCAAGIFHVADSFYRLGVSTTTDLAATAVRPAWRSKVRDAWRCGLGDPSERSWHHLLALTCPTDPALERAAAQTLLTHAAVSVPVDFDSTAALLGVRAGTLRFAIIRWYLCDAAAGIKEPAPRLSAI
ncbi:hypothetical protein ONR57_17715 [Hoyosella sp. YIM 151337]|uniref:hypothetical protein n=1 Tax=Hoyosella sp. YIM 151337 TaxID=2992742 RepID=UPI0022361A02|nr:hypothetical protein [Hoyosella sp. YIM 151337]MCW4355147.1 hypothetical protein [Hoyosella sp. YIM 151337]